MSREKILANETFLGLELGSTRIKAVLIDADHKPLASGSFAWENRLENGIWTYSLEDAVAGLQACYADLRKDVKEKYGADLKRVGAIGISGMMHGYLAFDETGKLLAPFRTWRNTMTAEAAQELSALFDYNIPQRWSIAHL
ncbi:MAG TPA: FGGY family carbohydrate kinase, partial [Clostridiales bacterium]|nr:FGGY family carbohydrate kinase [Clostridiales bacterium]